jgi:methylenetetrahydrofolate reductase (NADPH)
MRASRFQQGLDSDDFLVTVELLTSPTDGVDSYISFFDAFGKKYRHRPGLPLVCAVTSPHSPGGVPTTDPFTVWSQMRARLPEGLDAIAHVTCKDMNRNGIETHLRNLRSVGVQNILALTGDYPVDSKPVFELDSLGLIRLIVELNGQAIDKSNPDALDDVFQFTVGAGMNPYKYSLASCWQQYVKMAKKTLSGASFILTQVGYDMRSSEDLIRYTRAHELDAPVFGNVYLLTKRAAERMNAGELPGCYASDRLVEVVSAEWKSAAKGRDAAIERMAWQTALFRHQGFRGAHIGGWGLTYADVQTVIERSQELLNDFDPDEARKMCHYPPPNAQYFIGDDGEFVLPSTTPKPTARQRALEFVHEHVTAPESFIGRRVAKRAEADAEREGFRAKALYGVERISKTLLVHCRDCGDCRLPDNYYALCNEAACAKGLPNLPCGDSDALTGRCGNDDDVICAGELVFYAAFARGKLGELSKTVQPTKIPELRGTSAVMNYLAGLDHRGRLAGQLRETHPLRRQNPDFIIVGEYVHAQIPRVFWAMNEVLKTGNKRFTGPLAYLAYVITSQVVAGADYIAVNVDNFEKSLRPDLMRMYVDMVNSLAPGVPVCVDSSDNATKAAGIEQYFKTARNPENLPMVNSINAVNPKEILELRERYPFKVVAMLHQRVDKDGLPQTVDSIEEIVELAHHLFGLLKKVGCKPEDVFFDTAVAPIAADYEAKHTHQTMHGIRAVSQDSALRGTHTLIGLTNCSHMMPNRAAINRAYLYVAMEHGLSAAVLDPRVDYGAKEPGKQILSIIRDLAANDGSDMMAGMEIFERVAEYSRKYGGKKKTAVVTDDE